MGTCHGFRILSDEEFVYLRDGESGDPLRVRSVEASLSPPLTPLVADIRRRDEIPTRVHQNEGGFLVWMEGVGTFDIDPVKPAIDFPAFLHPTWIEGVIWGLPAALAILARGGLMLHAASVEIAGQAVLFAAPGGHGKTTLAAWLAGAGHRLLSEDLIRCRLGSEPAVFPGPAMLRLRHDVADWLPMPAGKEVMSDVEKIHLALSADARGTGDPVPLAAVFLLHQASGVAVSRCEPAQVLNDLWSIALNIPNSTGRAACFAQIVDLSSAVPIWELRRPLTPASLEEVAERVLSVLHPA